ncbi:MAG: FkbM family methyltransferase [Planctomycetota bacterium]
MNGVKQAVRSVARPVVQFARKWLEPTPEKVVVDWYQITGGPGKGAEILLPFPSGFADQIIPGRYELACTGVMEALVTEESVCVDIGAHYGYFTLVLASLASNGRVETFEPLPQHADRVAKSASRSHFDHVTVHPKAVADIRSTMTLRYMAEGNYDSMSYLESRGGVASEAAKEQYPTFESLSVETVRLDDLLELKPDFIKIDAEGAEASILRGGSELLSHIRPRLLVEVHGIREAFECANVIRQFGYNAFVIGEPEVNMPVLCLHKHDTWAIERLDAKLETPPSMIFEAMDG